MCCTNPNYGDTALTYAWENGHTDVAEIILYYGTELEHYSDGLRTTLMKACRTGHIYICIVKFLITKGADVNRQTTNNDHTTLSLACAGGHQTVVELLLKSKADKYHKLKDNSTMLLEAAKGGHLGVVQVLFEHSQQNALDANSQLQQQIQSHQQQNQMLEELEKVI
jgi:ankyrin repeat domain-containing protein 17